MQLSAQQVPNADKAVEIKQQASRNIAAVRENKTLSAVGRRREIESIYNEAVSQLNLLRGRNRETKESRRRELESSLFGALTAPSGADSINFRDADDRASRLETEREAASLMERALQTRDRVLASAIARQAVSREWVGVLNQWANGDTWVEGRVSELLAVRAELGETLTGVKAVAAGLATEFVFQFSKPQELEMSEGWAATLDRNGRR
jgi:hypothetical protein